MVESYISVDLNDPRMKYLSEIFGNESCKKILNLLSEKELTETEIAHELKMPLNSVDYNIKKLVKSGLIESSKHWWSVKGKKMPSYRISNKKIVISPKRVSSSFIIPLITTALIAVLGVGKYITNQKNSIQDFVQSPAGAVTDEVSLKAASSVGEVASASYSAINDSAAQASGSIYSATSHGFFNSLSGFEWLIFGIWIGSVLFFVLNYIFERRTKWKNQ